MERDERQQQDHDLLMRIDTNVTNFMGKFEDHTEDDTKHLNRLYERTSRLEKIVWMALGVIMAGEFVLRVLK